MIELAEGIQGTTYLDQPINTLYMLPALLSIITAVMSVYSPLLIVQGLSAVHVLKHMQSLE